jgi:hypothetical protein
MKKQARLWISCTLLLFPATFHAQGFGMISKKSVMVSRLLPPTVNLKGKKIWVEATADSAQKDGTQLRELLKTKLVTLIQKDPRFILNESSPETLLKFSITNFYLEKYTTGSGSSARVMNRGKIEVAYQAINLSTNAALDSEILEDTAGYDPTKSSSFTTMLRIDKKQSAAEGSENETRDQLVSGIVELMAKRIAPLDHPFEAPLPGGKLEPLSALAQSNRWGALEDQAEKMEKLPKGTDDTYRLYLIALAKEAQAYDLTREANERDLGKRTDISPAQADEEFHRAQKYLDESGATYKEIIQANPKEKEFRAGDTRTEEALAIYAKIERFKAENDKIAAAKASETAAAKDGRKVPAEEGTQHITPLEQVIDYCNKGLAADSIEEYIASPDFLADARATKYKFDFARDAIRLNDACKANAAALQKAIRGRLGNSPSATSHKN